MIELYDLKYNNVVNTTCMFFPGGEPNVGLPDYQLTKKTKLCIKAHVRNSNDFMELCCVVEALKAQKKCWLGLYIPYFPGARQDRQEPGRCFTAKVYANIINSMNLDCVVVADPHSDVTTALINNCHPISQEHILRASFKNWTSCTYEGLICPDSGAKKKIEAVGRAFGIKHIVMGSKVRNTSTGLLTDFHCETFPTKGPYLLVDDICDGGATFIGLKDAIHDGPSFVDLYITHGIFSKGFMELQKRFRRIYTTNSFSQPKTLNEQCIPINIDPLAHQIMLGVCS